MPKPQNTPTEDFVLYSKMWYKSHKSMDEVLGIIIQYHYLFVPDMRDIMRIVHKDVGGLIRQSEDILDEIYKQMLWDDPIPKQYKPADKFAYFATKALISAISCISVKGANGEVLLHVPSIDFELMKLIRSTTTES